MSGQNKTDNLKNQNSVIEKVKKLGIVFAMLLIIAIFSIATDRFLSLENFVLILRQVSIYGLMACGMTYVIIGGNFDLSVGSLLSFTCVLVISLHDTLGPWVAMLVALLAGIASGLISGYLVGYLRLNSMMVTLGMMGILQAVTLMYAGGTYSNIAAPDETWFTQIGRGDFLDFLPIPIIIFIVVMIISEIVLKKTLYGRRLLAVGGNAMTCRFTGINDKKIIMKTFVVSGLMTAIAGIVLGSRQGAAQNTIGEGYEFEVITGVILGGTSLQGGSGSVIRTFVGILIMGILRNGFVMVGFPHYTQWIAQWVIIVAVVWLDIISSKKKVSV